jgi:RNA polymerase sigma-70 factor (ECF subfamily)
MRREGEVELADVAVRLSSDEEAVGQAYQLLAPTVLAYLRRLLPAADAEDVLQKTFLDVWRSREQYDPHRSLAGWIMGIAKHRAADHLRARAPDQPMAVLPDDASEGDDDLAERFSRSVQVREALARLSPEQRQVLVLAYFEDLSLPQIAEWLGAPLGTVKARAARGLRACARELERRAT